MQTLLDKYFNDQKWYQDMKKTSLLLKQMNPENQIETVIAEQQPIKSPKNYSIEDDGDDCYDVTPKPPTINLTDDDDIQLELSQNKEEYINSLMVINPNIKIESEKCDDSIVELSNTVDYEMEYTSSLMNQFLHDELNTTRFKKKEGDSFKQNYLMISNDEVNKTKYKFHEFLNVVKNLVPPSVHGNFGKRLKVLDTIPHKHELPHTFISNEYEITLTPNKTFAENVWLKLQKHSRRYFRHIKKATYNDKTYRFRMSRKPKSKIAVFDLKRCVYGFNVSMDDEHIKKIDVKYAREMPLSVTPDAKLQNFKSKFDDYISREFIFINCESLDPSKAENKYKFRFSCETKVKHSDAFHEKGRAKKLPNKIKYDYKFEFEMNPIKTYYNKKDAIQHPNSDLTYMAAYEITKEFLENYDDSIEMIEKIDDNIEKHSFVLGKYNFWFDVPLKKERYTYKTNAKIKLSNIIDLYVKENKIF